MLQNYSKSCSKAIVIKKIDYFYEKKLCWNKEKILT